MRHIGTLRIADWVVTLKHRSACCPSRTFGSARARAGALTVGIVDGDLTDHRPRLKKEAALSLATLACRVAPDVARLST